MSHTYRPPLILPAILMAAGLVACNGEHVSTQANATGDVAVVTGGGPDCVPLPDGYYLAEGGLFSPVQPAPQPQAENSPQQDLPPLPDGWAGQVQQSFAGLGFPWMSVRVRDEVATLLGTAPNRAEKEKAMAAGSDAILKSEDGGEQIELIADGIAIEGEEVAIGAPLAKLSQGNITLATCQAAFNETLDGQQIRFQSNSAVITEVNARLLDALTGVARLCDAFEIEVAGHTSARGSDSYNMELSQQRADSVKFYLTEKGVPEETLVATGYGESKLLDRADTPEAHAKNQRTEFMVRPRP